MKNIVLFILTISLAAVLMIVHINQNVALIKRSYVIRDKERELAVISDQYKQLVFELNALHSPGMLENKILQSGIKLIHPTDIKIIKNMVPLDATLLAKNINAKDRFGILGGLEFLPEAHANSSE
ncbi:MAG: hypothetical protein JW938_00710 [Candidatus Omnitrophica bacterium]|nr:hypothetical protein [Candidatus Omnitrophota bacterium]